MSWRGFLGAFAAVFLVVVSSSFGYGLFLLTQGREGGPDVDEAGAALPTLDVPALLARGRGHMEKGEVEQGILAYRRVLAATPSAVEALFGLAEGERLAGREAVAGEEYERVLRADPRHAPALLRVAHLYAGRQETWADAGDRYRRYLELKPADAEARLGLARVLAWSGRAAEAVALYSDGAVQALFTPQDRRDHALALLEAGRPAEAEPLLAALSAEAPQDVDLQRARAGVFAARQEWDTAVPMYREVLQHRPDDPHANLAYGQGLMALRDYRGAVGPLSRAASRLPSHADAHLAYARTLRTVGDLKAAEREFERAMALIRDQPETAREYADLLMERRSYGKAEDWYRRALSGGIRDERLLLGLGGALSAGGKPREALPFLEEAYRRQPSDRLALDLARLYRRLGQNERALQLLATVQGSKRGAR